MPVKKHTIYIIFFADLFSPDIFDLIKHSGKFMEFAKALLYNFLCLSDLLAHIT